MPNALPPALDRATAAREKLVAEDPGLGAKIDQATAGIRDLYATNEIPIQEDTGARASMLLLDVLPARIAGYVVAGVITAVVAEAMLPILVDTAIIMSALTP